MFGTQSLRLLRDKWSSAKDLAMELYAMFQDNNPVETGGGLTVSAPPGVAPLTLLPASYASAPAIRFGSHAADPAIKFNPQESPGLTFEGPSFTFVYTNPDGTPGQTDLGGKNPTAPASSSMPGKILGGKGSTYQVRVYPSGLSGKSKVVTVVQMSISSKAAIPVGTWTVVVKNGTDKKPFYSMQVPVWS